LKWAIRLGRSIFEREQYWTSLAEKWSDHLPFPSPEPSEILALRFERFAAQLVSAGDFDAALEQIIGMLTHMGRASLIRARVYPASRPELPAQLRGIGEHQLAEWLEQALRRRYIAPTIIDRLTPEQARPQNLQDSIAAPTAADLGPAGGACGYTLGTDHRNPKWLRRSLRHEEAGGLLTQPHETERPALCEGTVSAGEACEADPREEVTGRDRGSWGREPEVSGPSRWGIKEHAK
jgi:hypothetical protein